MAATAIPTTKIVEAAHTMLVEFIVVPLLQEAARLPEAEQYTEEELVLLVLVDVVADIQVVPRALPVCTARALIVLLLWTCKGIETWR